MRCWRCYCGGPEYEAADDEVGVLLVLGEEGGEGDCEMVERGCDVDLDGGLGFHAPVLVSLLRREQEGKKQGERLIDLRV